ncbi:MAG: cobyric acid synthase CobQ [Cyanobacteriota bacterium]|nr:cobyric acid synthase CobQ [Cyanobacteriota bacterium]
MKAIMVVGTTSHAGKSLITSSICRILARKGIRVAPFKGQNMALNSYVTANGGEIGYAQAVQAWAAGVSPSIEMNPILLKPQGDMTSQIILKGRPAGVVKASEYYEKFFDIGWQSIQESLAILGAEFDVIVCEGAGSPAEINLKHRDLTNMRVAKHLNADTLLVVDIDRGGAFAHVVGTLELLEPEERKLIKGVVINKFRGQRSILEPGIKWLEERTGIPVLGVIPWIDEVFPAEDSVSLLERRSSKDKTDLNIAVLRLPRISNFTDFDALDAEPTVTVKYLQLKDNLGYPDAAIIPGSKTTIGDMLQLKKTGMDEELKKYLEAGGTVMGICGGFQMLGQTLVDADGMEGQPGTYKGLGFLPIKTFLGSKKITRQRQVIASYPLAGLPVEGYEIHHGRTQLLENTDDIVPLFDDPGLGIVNTATSVLGNYLHGIFDNGPWRRSWLNFLRKKRGLDVLPTGISNYREQREAILNSVTDSVAEHLDLDRIINN